jgi:dTDP-4-amino-4,6-dideoxygalactose transaminase
MKKLQMVDLKGQMEHIRPELDEAVKRVMDSGRFIGGPEVEAFAAELSEELDGAFVMPCANGTDALQIALMALGVGPGDEVITPAFTFISTVEVVMLLGAKPVLVDVDARTFNIDPLAIEAAITERTKAVIPVHLFGQCASMGTIMEVTERHDVPVIEDSAQSILSYYCDENGVSDKAGTIGLCGTTSFFPSKNLGCMGDGGAIFTRSEEFAQKVRTIANHGSQERYKHLEVGVNSRLDSLQAAMLRVKLPHLKEYNAARFRAACRYDELLAELSAEGMIKVPARDHRSSHVFNQYTIKICDKLTEAGATNVAMRAELTKLGVPSAIYYPMGIHEQEAFAGLGYKKGDMPVSEKLSQTVLSLPMHTELSVSQQLQVVASVKKVIKKWI